jgi:HEAT repeat protein
MRSTLLLAALALGSASILSAAAAPGEAVAQARTPTKRTPRRTPQAPATPDPGGDTVHADPQGVPAAAAPTIADLPEILPRLRSTNADEVRQAIDALRVIDRAECVPPLAELVRSGQPDAITDAALEAFRGLAEPSSIDVLTEITRHRRAGARRRAYAALAGIADRRIPTLLEQGLRDSDRNVRAACALALGNIGARGSVDILFRAFERGVVEAAVSIGKLGNEGSVERFSAHLGQQPLSVMLSGYEQYLRRTDIAEQTKIAIVNRLGEVSGRQVREFLSAYLATFAARDRSRLRTVVQDTLRRIPLEGDGRRTATVGSAEAGSGATGGTGGTGATDGTGGTTTGRGGQ